MCSRGNLILNFFRVGFEDGFGWEVVMIGFEVFEVEDRRDGDLVNGLGGLE